MQHRVGPAGNRAQRFGAIQVEPVAARNGAQLEALRQLRGGTMGDVAEPDDQQALHPAILRIMHNITLTPGGETFQVESGESVLAAALRSGIVIPYGCKNGACS